MRQSRSFAESQTQMRLVAQFVIDLRIRSYLTASLGTRPSFRRAHEASANAASLVLGRNVPAFDVSNRAGSAAFRHIAELNFDESSGKSIFDRKKTDIGRFAERLTDVSFMALNGVIGPQLTA